MSRHRTIRMVERADGTGYRQVTRAEVNRLAVVLEGVDGDEDANTVTYWYRRMTDDER